MRTAEKYDLARIVEIYNSAIPTRLSTADISPVSIEDKEAWFRSHGGDRPLYVYETKGEIIGWASFEAFYGRPAYHATAELSIYVDQDHLQRGHGSHILAECLRLAPQRGIRTIVSYVFSHNTGSIRLLEKFGFQRWGMLPDVAEMDGKPYSLSILGFRTDVP